MIFRLLVCLTCVSLCLHMFRRRLMAYDWRTMRGGYMQHFYMCWWIPCKTIRFGLAAAKIGGNIQHYCKVLVIPIRVIPSLHTLVYVIGATSWNFCLDIWHVVVGAWISSRVQKTLVKVLPWGRRFWLLSSSTYSFAYSAWVPLVTEFVTFICVCVRWFSSRSFSFVRRQWVTLVWSHYLSEREV